MKKRSAPSAPRNGEALLFKFELVSREGESLGCIETAEANRQADDTIIGHGNKRYRMISVIPLERTRSSSTSRRTGSSRSNRSRRANP
jgi:hypothetical protein